MSFSTGFRKCKKCGKTLFGLFDGELCDECEKAEQEPKDDKCHYCEHNFTPYQGNTGEFTEQEPCDDAISRNDMLDAVGHGTTYTSLEVQKIINGLPSVNPVPCDDVVSRQAVLDIVNNPLNIRLDEIIKKLPSVRPQEQTGHWIDLHRCWVCSECGQETHIEHNYCPNCGCRMVEESEDKE